MNDAQKYAYQYFLEIEPPPANETYKRYLLDLNKKTIGNFEIEGRILFLQNRIDKTLLETKADGKIFRITIWERRPDLMEDNTRDEDKSKKRELLYMKKIKPTWQPDSLAVQCHKCSLQFYFFRRKHHCRGCGHVFCSQCSNYQLTLPPQYEYGSIPQRLCADCFNIISEETRPIDDFVLLVHFYLRDSHLFELTDPTRPLIHIGSRRPPWKAYASVKKSGAINNEHLLTIVDASRAPASLSKSAFCNLLSRLQHPYILPVIESSYLVEKKVLILFREFCHKGSLKDIIHRGLLFEANPREPYSKKYDIPGKPLPFPLICKFGRQILEGLAFLRSLDIKHYHLHTGNVTVVDSVCRLTDIENSLLGLPPYYTLTSKMLDPEVECFAYVLFEMAVGYERDTQGLKGLLPATIPLSCDKRIYQVLKDIFDSDLPKNPSLTVHDLLMFSQFAEVSPKDLVPFDKKVKLSAKMVSFLSEVNAAIDPLLEEIVEATKKERYPNIYTTEYLDEQEELHSRLHKPHQRIKKPGSTSNSDEQQLQSRPTKTGSLNRSSLGTSTRKKRASTLGRSSSSGGRTRGSKTKSGDLPNVFTPKNNDSETKSPPSMPLPTLSQSQTSEIGSPLRATTQLPGPAPPPPPPPPSKLPPPPPPSGSKVSATQNNTAPPKADNNRQSLLSSIEAFKKTALKKAVTNDRSSPLKSSTSVSTTSMNASNDIGSALAAAIAKRRATMS